MSTRNNILRKSYERAHRNSYLIKACKISEQQLRPSWFNRYGSYKPERFDISMNGEIHFASPLSFNDPLDSRLFLKEMLINDA